MGQARKVMLALAVAGPMAGCGSLRSSEPPPAPPSAVAPAQTPQPAPSPPAEVEAPKAPAPAAAPVASSVDTPPCMPARAKTPPRRKRHRSPEPKEAPPQLPTADVVAETPKGGVVNAEVKAMPVSVMSILGKPVKGAKGEDLGRVVDVLADATGRVRVAIIDFGGFMGVGDRRIAVDWPLLRFRPDAGDSSLLLSVSPEKLKTAPEYKDNPKPQTLMEPEAAAQPVAVTPTATSPASGAGSKPGTDVKK